MSAEIFGFDEVLKGLEKFDNIDKQTDNILVDTATACIAETQARTPVDTGTLRRGFQATEIEKTEDGKKIEVFNDIEYFIPVEEGHKQGSGFVEGRHMLHDGYTIGRDKMVKMLNDMKVGK